MTSLLRPALALSLLAPVLVLSQGCNRASKPAANQSASANAQPATASSDDAGLMKAKITCPNGKPEYKVEGREVIVNCPG
jgi:hypothetical protein